MCKYPHELMKQFRNDEALTPTRYLCHARIFNTPISSGSTSKQALHLSRVR